MSQNVSLEGDPGKHAYLHNPNWKPAPRENLRDVKAMPGTCLACVFGEGQHAEGCIMCAGFVLPISHDIPPELYRATEKVLWGAD